MPAVRKQFAETVGRLGRQALEEILEVAVRIEPVDLGGLDLASRRPRGEYAAIVPLLAKKPGR